MRVLQKIKSRLSLLKIHPTRRVLLGLGLFFGVVVLYLMVSYVIPRTIAFSYANPRSCIVSPTLFPAKVEIKNEHVFAVQYMQTLAIAHVTLYAGEVCVTPFQSPKADTSYVVDRSLSYISPFKKKITVHTAQYVRVTPVAVKGTLSPISNLMFQLSQPDNTFTYAADINNQRSVCADHGHQLTCPLKHLTLQYGQQYNVQLVRTYTHDDPSNVTKTSFQTITATTITATSIANGSTVYDKPQQVTFQTDKALVDLGAVTATIKGPDGTVQALPVTASFKDSTITVSMSKPLLRKATVQILISSLKAQDSSGLVVPYNLSFAVSGGPQVTGTSLPKYDALAGSGIVINFDQTLDQGQGRSQVTLLANGAAIPVSTVVQNSRMVVTPQASYPVCAHLTLQVGSNVMSEYGITGDSAYSYTSRARCYTTFSIGTSVDGNAITAYKIGTGSTQVLFIGTMHGTEDNAGVLLDKWLNDLEVNVDNIPAGRSVVVIPRINPDGVALGTRRNADNIDINRNFPAADWQSVVTEPDGYNGPAGGPNPLSEPESQAIASYVQAQRPAVTIDYHSHAGIVQSNSAGDADALALQYALTSGYSLLSNADTGSEFDYDTTGSFEDWTNQQLGLPEFLVELSSPTNDEFGYNRSAMWGVVRGSL